MVLFENEVPFFNKPVSNIPSFKRRLVLVKKQLTKQKTKTKNKDNL